MEEKPVIGFVGVGLMGHGMAKNVVENGYDLLVTAHRKREAVDDLVKRGAREVENVEAMAAEADIIFLCVTGSPQVEDNVSRIMAVMKPGLIVVDTSTAEPASTRALAEKMNAAGGALVDGPLSRTPAHAWSGELSSFLSGPKDVLAKVRPVVETYTAAIIDVSENVGDAHSMKLVNNLVSLGYVALWSECYATLGKLGVAPGVFREAIRNSGMVCGNFENYSKYICDGDPNGHKFSLSNGHKDMTYYKAMAEQLSADRPMSAATLALLSRAIDADMAERFVPELIDVLKD